VHPLDPGIVLRRPRQIEIRSGDIVFGLLLELELDPKDVLPPMKSAGPDAGPIVR